MSQQRLITLMEEERDALQKKNKQLTTQVEELVEENKNVSFYTYSLFLSTVVISTFKKQLQVAAMEWRTKALATEQAFVAFAGERAGTIFPPLLL